MLKEKQCVEIPREGPKKTCAKKLKETQVLLNRILRSKLLFFIILNHMKRKTVEKMVRKTNNFIRKFIKWNSSISSTFLL